MSGSCRAQQARERNTQPRVRVEVALDLVEVNPVLDSQNMTGILAAELAQSALGKTIL